MRSIFIVLFVVMLTGCAGLIGGYKNDELVGFVKASMGKAKGVYSWFTGSGNYCNLEWFNVSGVVVEKFSYTDGNCSIEWRTANGKPLTYPDKPS